MLQPRDLYELEIEASDALRARAESSNVGPVMLITLRGFAEAGHVAEISGEHLMSLGDTKRIATFDHDRLTDYHAKRPTLTFEGARFTDYHGPHIALDLLSDAEGTQFLVLHGIEPDRYWDAFVSAVMMLINEFNVSLVVSLAGIPMGVPHTRPNGAILHATRDGLIEDERAWAGSMEIPASVANVIQFELGQRERDGVGVAVHVPHYLAQSQYSPAALTALSKVEGITGLDLSITDLAGAAEEALAEVERQASKSAEITEMITALEAQYDAFMAAHPEESLLAKVNRIPTAEELGAEFEAFLSQFNPDRPDTSGSTGPE